MDKNDVGVTDRVALESCLSMTALLTYTKWGDDEAVQGVGGRCVDEVRFSVGPWAVRVEGHDLSRTRRKEGLVSDGGSWF